MDDQTRYVTGNGAYVDDTPDAGHLHMAVMRAPSAHGRIVSLDLTEARDMPGVACVLGPEELAAQDVGPLEARARIDGMVEPYRPVLASGKFAYLGQPLAAVVADTVQAARLALEAIEFDYEDLPPVLDPATATNAPQIWDDVPDNRVLVWDIGNDTDPAFAQAAHVVSLRVQHPRTAMAPVETRGCIASFDGTRFTLTTPSQGVYGIKAALSSTLGLNPDDLRVITGDVGGSFAVKIYPYPEHVLALLAARITGKTVRWISSRSEAMAADAIGRGRVDDGALALDKDGRFLALRIKAFGDLGAFVHTAGAMVFTGGATRPFGQTYDIPAMHYAVEAVLTTQAPTDAYRGAGKPESGLTLERLIDKAAAEIGIDRFELRRRNLIRPDQIPYNTAVGETYDAGDFPGLAQDLHAASDWDGFSARKAASAAAGLLRGIGVTFPLHASGGNRAELARIAVLPNGEIELRIGVQDNGQGQRDALAMIAAETLEVDVDRIVVRTGDSDLMPSGGSTGGSSMLAISGNTTFKTARDLIELLRPRAADHLEVASADLDYGNGGYTVIGTDRRVTLTELAAEQDQPGGSCAAEGAFEGIHTTFPNAGFVAEVDVDPETGGVQLDRFTVISDLGRIIQEGPAFGQIHGGIAQGLGEALMEALVSDSDGQLLTGSWMDYAMPRADDMCDIAITHRPTGSPNSALGTKGAGELPSIGAPSVIVNAVLDAIGVDHLDRPLTPEKIWRACTDTDG